MKRAVSLTPHGRYESEQHSSVKSLTALVLKEEERYSVSLGPIPMARNSLCALNEISAMNSEDQNHLLDIMEEGEHTLNKYHFHTKIKSPTVITVSTNLTECRGEYFDSGSGKISVDQINLQKQLLDRFDLIVVLKDNGSIEAVKEYTEQKIQLQSKSIPKYDAFLQKYLEYARKIDPEVSPEAADMIGNYYINLHKSNRHLKSKGK
jgi:DNA replicative helicase MCM subunit Mcm2 (Cdc46/Mcm family)